MLHAKAEEEPDWRFHSLIDKVWREDFLAEAWRRVRRNGGAAGVDGETFADIESHGVGRWLGELARDLKDGTYVPKPVRQVLIPKKQPGKFRPLGIPCVRDRVAQTSALLVLEPIFEADLQPEQYSAAIWLRSAELTGAGESVQVRREGKANHYFPGSNRTRVAAETMRGWTADYRRGGFEALYPKPRTDRGKPRRLPAEIAERLIALKTENPGWSVRIVIEAAHGEGIDHPLAPSTVHRLFSREGLFDRKPPDGADRRRFAFREAGEMWMSDVMHGPKVRHGRTRRKTYLIAFIDDAILGFLHVTVLVRGALRPRDHDATSPTEADQAPSSVGRPDCDPSRRSHGAGSPTGRAASAAAPTPDRAASSTRCRS